MFTLTQSALVYSPTSKHEFTFLFFIFGFGAKKIKDNMARVNIAATVKLERLLVLVLDLKISDGGQELMKEMNFFLNHFYL